MQNVSILNSADNTKRAASRTIIGRQHPPRPWLQDFWLWILLVGPLVAPLFVVLGIPVLRPFADAIYLLGATICPKPGVHLMVFDQRMAVCSSCWAAVWGLWAVRLLYGRAGEGFGPFSKLRLGPIWARWQSAPTTTRLSVLALGFMLWALDVALWDMGAWASPHIFMMLAGFTGGLTAGLLMLPAASQMRTRLADAGARW